MTTATVRLTLRRTIRVAESSPIALSPFAQERLVAGVLAATSTIWILPMSALNSQLRRHRIATV